MASDEGDRQGVGGTLLPRLPDTLTVHSIVPKVKWVMYAVLKGVNQGWKHVLCDRRVYIDRVLSHSTDAFLVLLSVDCKGKFVSILYSVNDGYTLHLPPIPTEDLVLFKHCICLNGKVFLWVLNAQNVIEVPATIDLWILDLADLAGDRKWCPGRRQRSLPGNFCSEYEEYRDMGYGVLNGNIFNFKGSTHPHRGVLNGGITFQGNADEYQHCLPETKVYEPESDVWSFSTPQRSGVDSDSWSQAIAPILHWAREKFGEDHSEAFSKDLGVDRGWYEPYFSEWRSKYSGSALQSAPDDKPHKDQVYYTNTVCGRYREHIFFFGTKLAKFTADLEHGGFRNDTVLKLDLYDTSNNTWKEWVSIGANFPPAGEEGSHFYLQDVVSTEGVIWVVLRVSRDEADDDLSSESTASVNSDELAESGDSAESSESGNRIKYQLLRSPVLDDNSDSPVSWIYTGQCLAGNLASCILRPIYL